jgi:cold-inducible RNA-binding protein
MLGDGAGASARVFVGNLSFQTSKDDLVALLSRAGRVVDAYLPADRETGRPRGFAFVTFSSDAEAAEAIRRFHDHEVNGRKLVVNAAEPRVPGGRPTGPRPGRPGSASPPPFFDRDRPAREKTFKTKGSRRGLRARKRSL